MNLPQNLQTLNFSLITINFHPTDIEAFDFFYKTIFLPNFIYKCPLYVGTKEYDNTLNRHLHFVVGYTSNDFKDNDNLRSKLNGKKILKQLNLLNTDTELAGINVKTLNKDKDDSNFIKSIAVMKSIGYCLKETIGAVEHNIREEDLSASYEAYMYSVKKPIGLLDNPLEYKILSVGNLLSYMFDSYKKSGFEIYDLVYLETYMIQHHKLSFIKITDKQKTQAIKELQLHLTDDANLYKKFKTEIEYTGSTADDIFQEYDDYQNPKNEMMKEILYLRNQVELLSK